MGIVPFDKLRDHPLTSSGEVLTDRKTKSKVTIWGWVKKIC